MEKIKRVYIADRSAYREQLINYLKDKGDVQVIGQTDDGMIAEEEIASLKPDIVIMDVVLSNKDGFVLLDNLKKRLEYNIRPKVIVVSELSHEGFMSKALKMGVSFYLKKPVSMDIIYTKINEVNKSPVDADSSLFSRSKMKMLEEKISNIFITVGIPAHIKGYHFLREAIKMSIEQPDIINSITKKLYPSIAERFDTTASKVERAIRHAIEVAWNRGKIENINNVFGIKVYNSQDKPTNGEFIALVADKMIFDLEEA